MKSVEKKRMCMYQTIHISFLLANDQEPIFKFNDKRNGETGDRTILFVAPHIAASPTAYHRKETLIIIFH